MEWWFLGEQIATSPWPSGSSLVYCRLTGEVCLSSFSRRSTVIRSRVKSENRFGVNREFVERDGVRLRALILQNYGIAGMVLRYVVQHKLRATGNGVTLEFRF